MITRLDNIDNEYEESDGSIIKFRVNANAIRNAIKEQCVDPIIALSKNNAVMWKIADRAIKLMNKYVPNRTGDLRSTAKIQQHARSTTITYGDVGVGRTSIYAIYQYERDIFHPSPVWKYNRRKEPYARGEWFDVLEPGTVEYQRLVDYAETLMRKAVKK